MAAPMAGRVALVTGASRGIGRALAVALAGEGAHVIALARTVGALEELDDEIRAAGSTATLVPADLADVEALDRLGLAIHERWGKLDAMVANAGALGPITPLGHVEPKAFDDIMAINVTATYRLIRSMDPLLRASDAGRAMFMSSGAVHNCRAYWGPYSASKAAVEALARTYAAETLTTAIRVSIVNPGPLRTRMRAAAMPGEDPMTLRTPEDLAPKLLPMLRPAWTETGRIYDFPQDKLLTPQKPA
ncbi:SDR family NAD(P)-dependent oxidoreductase [Chelatococcus reniformis]|uniref:Oxidoreductase n=1 Tax=Chelatococcus reniformis TaxID=1494448 RepID=A0A916XHQ8_9HYPH|nr:SDR family NAD(P)-dependent oxidoreductase [Chelatococcus reniformis]GGC74323.1 oxidoreductase [Chelatococcus reniformis]